MGASRGAEAKVARAVHGTDFAWKQRCHAHNRAKAQCGNWAVTGMYVCRTHGGSVKRTRTSALRNLLRDAAAIALVDLMNDGDSRVRLRAVRIALDAAGVDGRSIRLPNEVTPEMRAQVAQFVKLRSV